MGTELTFSEGLKNSLVDARAGLPTDLNIDRFVANAVALLNDNKPLQDFAKQYGTGQIKAGLIKSAYLGLDAMSKEVYLVPYGKSIQVTLDYRGSVKLCKKYSPRKIKDIYAKLVREGDTFEETISNGEPSIYFKPLPFNNGRIIGAFAVCLYQDGGMVYDTMSIEDLENTRSASKMKNSPAWTRYTGQMYLKTVLHRMCKHISLDFESADQLQTFREQVEDRQMDVREEVEAEIIENANTEDFIIEEDV